MIYSRSSQYAIRSMAYLAGQPARTLSRLETIAEREEIPRHFLAKIMQRLGKKRLVRSFKGVKGGFTLALPADQISLFMIIDAIDEISLYMNDCILGVGACQGACSLHQGWKELKARQMAFLQQTTIAEVVQGHESTPALRVTSRG